MAQIYPKKDLGLETEKSNVGIRINIVETLCANFQPNWTTLTFLAQICWKRKLGFEIQKTNVGIRVNIFSIPCVPIFRQNEQLWPFGPTFAQKWILRSKLQKSKSGLESTSLRYQVHQFSNKRDNVEFLGLNLPKNGFWGQSFKSLSLDWESTPPIYHVCQCLVEMDNIWFFSLNFGKLLNYMQYFGSNIVGSVAESWVEAKMSWVEVDRAEWRLKWAGWMWMELGGAGCTV